MLAGLLRLFSVARGFRPVRSRSAMAPHPGLSPAPDGLPAERPFRAHPTLRFAFPDLAWLKGVIASSRAWPSVVLNVAPAEKVERPDIAGPLSLFLNLRGESFCSVGGRRVRIADDTYFLTNPGDHYSLEIPPPDARLPATETFNLHFGTGLAETVLRDLTTPDHRLLDEPFADGAAPVAFWPRLYRKDRVFEALLARIRGQASAFNRHPLLRDQLLMALLAYLLGEHRRAWRTVEALPAARAATRQELYRRISHSIDYLYAHYEQDLDLATLAQVACLSRFHYLRVFRTLTGQTPFAFVRQLRLGQARRLLSQTRLPVGAVALQVGFESDSAFHRAFLEVTGQGPLAWRLTHAEG